MPHAEGPIKGAVVKTYGQEATKPVDDGITVRHQAARYVLSRGLRVVNNGQLIREAVGRSRRLHQRVGVVPRHRERTPRPVVLKGSGDHPLAAGDHRRGDGIALHSGQVAPVKTCAHRGIALDAATVGQWQSLRHESASTGAVAGEAPGSNSSAGS